MTEQHQQEMKNLEIVTLVWLDKHVYEQQNEQVSTVNCNLIQPSRQQLRSIINFIKVFDQVDACEYYIQSVDQQEHIVLISSGTYGKEIVSKLHGLTQLRSVYIYCMNEQEHESWVKQFPKIRGVFNNSDHLLTKLTNDQKFLNTFSTTPITFLSRNKDVAKRIQQQKILTKQNGQFLWFQLVIELFCNEPVTDEESHQAIKELSEALRQYFRENDAQFKTINDFETNYEPEHAIWWYTKEQFFYSIINKALRTYDIDTIIVFRAFINHMYQLLKKCYDDDQRKHSNNDNNIFQVYRGQAISFEELEQIKRNKGEFISFNSFLSTTRSRNNGRFFTDASGAQIHGLHSILFEFQVNPNKITKPYTDVSRFSQHGEEEEVLFMIGSIFRIVDIFYDQSESIWIAQLILMDENSYELHDVFQSLKKHKIDDNSLINLANILEDMGEYEKAEKILHRSLLQSSVEQISHQYNCYDLLGTLAGRNGHFEQAIEYHIRSIELQKKVTSVNYEQLGISYNNLGKAYGMNGQIDLALSNLFESIKIKSQLFNDQNHLIYAPTYDNIGNCYFTQNKLDEAQENFQRAFDIRRENNMPENSPESIEYYMSVGNIFGSKRRYLDAIHYHKKAIEIARQVLPLDHPWLAHCYNNLGKDYADSKQYRLAKENYQQALDIYEQTVSIDHPEKQRTQDNLDEITTELWMEAGKLLLITAIIMLPLLLYTFN
ncbi:hypothetical protein I4U23_022289 [Adineta vaga]|nr:hypothetical protein I4U23_022289 [Adineta vaga]